MFTLTCLVSLLIIIWLELIGGQRSIKVNRDPSNFLRTSILHHQNNLSSWSKKNRASSIHWNSIDIKIHEILVLIVKKNAYRIKWIKKCAWCSVIALRTINDCTVHRSLEIMLHRVYFRQASRQNAFVISSKPFILNELIVILSQSIIRC